MSLNPSASSRSQTGLPPEDIDLVATWLVFDPRRAIAGVLGGLFAGTVATGLSVLMSVLSGGDPLFLPKLMASPLLGPQSMEFEGRGMAALVGFLIFEILAAFWGFVYAHFIKTNAWGSLLAMGCVWGFFSWIFEWNLFFKAFKTFLYAGVGAGPAFLVCMAYGISLTSVAFFDRILRGSSSASRSA